MNLSDNQGLVAAHGAIGVRQRLRRRALSILLVGAVAFIAPGALRADDAGPAPSYKLFFGAGKAPEGYTQVSPTAVYSKTAGYGFEPGAQVTAVDRGGAELLHAGDVTSTRPFYFSVAAPEGNYKVTVTLGDAAGESTTTIKAELRRLMVEEAHTAKGKFETRSFIVNVRTPKISTGGQVKLKAPRETTTEAWAWDDKLTLEFSGEKPALAAVQIEKVEVPTVFILGDSTVCDQSTEPYCSWGQMLPRFFKPDVAIANHAESGETVASSNGAGRFRKVLDLMKPGDYLLIQFGHNDMKSNAPNAPETYKQALMSWVDQVKAKGGTPILVTPMNRHSFQGNIITNSLNAYPDMVRQAAKEKDVTLIDLNALSKTLYETFGPDPSIQLFEHTPDLSKHDNTHHSPFGAYELAKCIAQGIQQSKLPLAQSLAKDFKGFDPAKPDAVAAFDVPPSLGPRGPRPLGD